MELIPAVQKYHWGKPANTSIVASLYGEAMKSANADSGGAIDHASPYAELWISTHPNGPSTLKNTKKSLLDFIKENPAVIGEKVKARFGLDDLPFLLKVLSVEQALSIQVHPDKPSAEILHKERPDLYKDPNHKPEMAIALTPFEMFCGFRAMDEIVAYLQGVPELKEIVGEEIVNRLASEKDKESLKCAYTRLLETGQDVITTKLDKLLARMKSMDANERRKMEADLIERLSKQYPGDIGIFSTFFLQHFTLQPGEAVFLPANEPHAYIYGDCVECMAASDNVIRAGLTPKFKDVKTLCSMLTYEVGKEWIIEGQECANGKGVEYNPPVDEFAVIKYESTEEFTTKPQSDSCAVILCVKGKGKAITEDGNNSLNLAPGTVLFFPCNPKTSSTGIKIIPQADSGPILLFEAFSTPNHKLPL